MFSPSSQYSPTSPAVSVIDLHARLDSTRLDSLSVARDSIATDNGFLPIQYSPTSPAVRTRTRPLDDLSLSRVLFLTYWAKTDNYVFFTIAVFADVSGG